MNAFLIYELLRSDILVRYNYILNNLKIRVAKQYGSTSTNVLNWNTWLLGQDHKLDLAYFITFIYSKYNRG